MSTGKKKMSESSKRQYQKDVVDDIDAIEKAGGEIVYIPHAAGLPFIVHVDCGHDMLITASLIKKKGDVNFLCPQCELDRFNKNKNDNGISENVKDIFTKISSIKITNEKDEQC